MALRSGASESRGRAWDQTEDVEIEGCREGIKGWKRRVTRCLSFQMPGLLRCGQWHSTGKDPSKEAGP